LRSRASSNAGEQITIEVNRPGFGLVGSATGTTAPAAVINAGNPAIEVNYPGEICWGTGGGLFVTPDIQSGDTVAVNFGGPAVGDPTTLDTHVTGSTLTDPATVVVQRYIAAGINPAQFEQRIIEPALTSTDVAPRDVRALPGPMTRTPKGGYMSGVEVSGQTFTATYLFDTPQTTQIAAGGGMRAMARSARRSDPL
jgi:hypothetical protein